MVSGEIARTVETTYELIQFDPNRKDWNEFIEMFKMNYIEVSGDMPKCFNFNPDYKNYVNCERTGHIVMVVARDTNGNKIIGYCIHSIWNHYNHKNILMAQRRAQYVLPDYRGLGIATEMLKISHEHLKLRGVKVVLLNTRAERPQKLGYSRLETVWMKEL